MIETVENRDELIKYSFNIIWKATEGKITNATFNTNPLFSVLNLTEQNEVPIIIDDEINSNIENLKKDQGSEFQDLDPVTYSSTIQENVIQAEDINLDRMDIDDKGEKILRIDDNSIECDNSVSPPFEETSSRAKSKEISSAKNSTYRKKSQDRTTKSEINKVFKHGNIERIPSTLTEDSPLPSENELSDIENVEIERTSIINEPNIGSGGVPFVFVNDPIPEFFVDKSKEPRTSHDSILVEYKDSDEEIEEPENLARKRKINRNYKASKKAKNDTSYGGEQNNDVEVMLDLSKITLENSQANNSSDG
ncbi:17806_t:CDS:10, partial [Gigaspora rosea]